MQVSQEFWAGSSFFSRFETLKQGEDWQEIIRLGIAALASKQLDDEQVSLVNCRIASCYFYLGEHKTALNAATCALERARALEHHDLIARCLYLISAAYRVLSQKESNVSHQENALKFINEAIQICEHHEIENNVKGKVYFNAGALFHDAYKDVKTADQHYVSALECYEEHSDDFNRTMIRHIRCLSDLDQVDDAKSASARLNIPSETKTGVHFAIVMARVLIKEQNFTEAERVLKAAKEVTLSKKMVREMGIINAIETSLGSGIRLYV